MLGSTGTKVGLCTTAGAGPGVLVVGLMGSNGAGEGKKGTNVGPVPPNGLGSVETLRLGGTEGPEATEETGGS